MDRAGDLIDRGRKAAGRPVPEEGRPGSGPATPRGNI
jgi:hypothetical protein